MFGGERMIDKNGTELCDVRVLHNDVVSKVREKMPDEDELFDLAELFKVFGDSTRIKILYVLFESEMCVCDIAEVLGASQSAVSHQLRIIKGERLIKARRVGKTVLYSLADDHVATIIGMAKEHLEEI